MTREKMPFWQEKGSLVLAWTTWSDLDQDTHSLENPTPHQTRVEENGSAEERQSTWNQKGSSDAASIVQGAVVGAAPPFKLLTRVNPNDGDGTGSGGPGNGNIGGSTNNNSSGGRGASMGLGSPQLPNSNLPPTASLPPQAPMYNAYSPMYGYNVQSPPMQASPLPSPSGGVGAVPQQRSRMQPIAPPSYMVPSQGPRGESGRMNQSSPGVSQSTPPNSGGRGGRRERSGSLMSHSGIYSASEQNLPEQQQQQQQPTHSAHDVVMAEHSEPDTKEPKEGKPRQEKRERSRRDRAIRQAQQLQQQDDASNSGKPPRLIMDPNSFQRQTLVQITGSAGNSLSNGGGGVGPSNSRGTGELFDDDYSRGMPQQQQQQQQQSSSVGETSSRSGNRRPPPPAGRAVYSWTGSSSSSSSPAMLSSNQPPQLPQQQQQHLSSLQQQQQQLPHQDQQHRQQLIQHMQQQQQLTPGYNPSHIRGATGPFSQPGHRDARSMGAPQTSVSVGGPHSAGGGRSILQQQGAVPLVAVPPPMRSHSTKLVNDCWKFVDGAEQSGEV
ncbi:hypothetical protein BGW38_003058 [Lunasporangiospora selenospora]|uniref:Uncharacterized protein n=1 Tax=Lunasporangiospora selenospora TaxID=979761 RepID=A0A9P6FRY1_9FUNG|nr:hypothetical protein BGW38_003058 [Lunasporangiospora selenospora]